MGGTIFGTEASLSQTLACCTLVTITFAKAPPLAGGGGGDHPKADVIFLSPSTPHDCQQLVFEWSIQPAVIEW